MKIDAHQHFWKYNPVRDNWIDDSMRVLRRDFSPEDLKPILDTNNIDGCIAVQADQSEAETQFLLELAEENDFIKGVVGWVDLCAPNVEERLTYFSRNKWFKGVRHILQGEDSDFMLQSDFQNGINKLKQFNLTYDILVHVSQLDAVLKFVAAFPEQKFVIDHLAKPGIRKKEMSFWTAQMIALAQFSNVSCKLSGMVTEAELNRWKIEDFKPYLDVVINAFGIDRVLYGSDWPVCLLSANYEEQFHIIENYISQFSPKDKEKVMGKNAISFYNLKSE